MMIKNIVYTHYFTSPSLWSKFFLLKLPPPVIIHTYPNPVTSPISPNIWAGWIVTTWN